jgi:ankyrin repeat protein
MAGRDRVKALFMALEDGDVEEVERLLDQHCGLLEARDEDNWNMTPLIWAAQNKCAEGLRLLLDRGAELEARDADGETALFRAASWGDEEVVSILLSRGADVRTSDINRVTPLQTASSDGYLGVVRLLVKHLRGQGLDDVDMGGCTALWWACRCGHTEAARVLLLAGADHTIPGAYNEDEDEEEHDKITPFEAAQERVHNDTVTLLQVIAHERLDVHTMHESSATKAS